jgi:hypothetical protein
MQFAFDFTAAHGLATPVTTAPVTGDLPARGTVNEEAAAEGTANDAVLQLVLPRAERLASLAYVAWPVEGVSVDDLTNDLVLEVLDALPFAPRPQTPAFDVWLSSTLMTTTYRRYTAAKAEARAHADAMRELAGVSTAAWNVDDEDDAIQAATPMTPRPQPARLTRQSVLATLDAEDARLLRWRADDATWECIARRLDVSPRKARRRHAAALEQARRLARGAPQDWAVVDRAA